MCSIGLMIALCLPGCKESSNSPPSQSTPKTTSTVSREDIEISLEAADKYFNTGELEKAEAILAVLISKAPGVARAREQYGMVHLAFAMAARKQGDMAEAERRNQMAHKAYQEAIGLDESSGGLQQSAGEIAHMTGHIDIALKCYLRAAELEPANPRPPLYAAQIYLIREHYDEAEKLLRRVIAIDGDLAIAHASIASVFLERNQGGKALASIKRARELDPDDLGIRSRHALILRRTGNPQQAVELLVALPEKVRAQEYITAEIAAGYEQLGKYRMAAQAWAYCFNTNQTLENPWRVAVKAGLLLLRSGDRKEAEMWLDEVKRMAPEAPEVIEFGVRFSERDPELTAPATP